MRLAIDIPIRAEPREPPAVMARRASGRTESEAPFGSGARPRRGAHGHRL